MAVRLDQAMFTRLIWLYIATTIAAFVAMVPQFTIGRWSAFDDSFDLLVTQQFGPDETPIAVVIAIVIALLAVLVWTIASIVGLLYFRRWARFGFWASLIAMFCLYFVIFGFRPVLGSPPDDLLATLSSALFGAIMLLAYADGYGADWFAKSSEH